MSNSDALSCKESGGPFRADQIRDGDPYELSNGHAIKCMSSGTSHGRTSLLGGSILDSDPAVESAGVDVGFSPQSNLLRAPDVAVGNVPDRPGWGQSMPPLAVEVADVGQDEAELKVKIDEYFAHGTRYVWVVRKVGPRRVEVHEPGQKPRTYQVGEELTAPGVLQNPVPVLAWFERDHAHDVTLRNLLNRKGFSSLEEVQERSRDNGRVEGIKEAVGDMCELLGIELTADRSQKLAGMTLADLAALRAHLKQHRAWPR